MMRSVFVAAAMAIVCVSLASNAEADQCENFEQCQGQYNWQKMIATQRFNEGVLYNTAADQEAARENWAASSLYREAGRNKLNEAQIWDIAATESAWWRDFYEGRGSIRVRSDCKTEWVRFNESWFSAGVKTEFCYRNGNVTSRHSIPGGRVKTWGVLTGWVLTRAFWKYSNCHSYRGYPSHNCLTQRQFDLVNGHGGDQTSICLHTRIYGNGDSRVRVTEQGSGLGACPGA